MIIRKSNQKGIRTTKIVGADLPLVRKKRCGVAGLVCFCYRFGFDVEIYKT
jgi:homoserine kinase